MINVLEEAIAGTYATLRNKAPDLCDCDRCREDVLMLALNQARPRYTAGNTVGAALVRLELSQDQGKAELAVIVYAAMQQVARNPRHRA